MYALRRSGRLRGLANVLSWRTGLIALAALLVVAGGLLWWATRAPPPPKDILGAIKSRGTVSIGVRSSAAPFSDMDASGGFVGYEPDIGRAIASALGAKAKFVVVDASNATKFLQRGLIDVAIVPRDGLDIHDTSIHPIDPGYYASGFKAVSLASKPLKDWEDLKDANVCVLRGNTPAERMVTEFGCHNIAFPDVANGLQALQAERCVAVVTDEVPLSAAVKADSAHQYSMALETMDLSPWSITVRAKDAPLADRIGADLAEWHKNGFLIARAAAWKLPDSPYLGAMRSYYSNRP